MRKYFPTRKSIRGRYIVVRRRCTSNTFDGNGLLVPSEPTPRLANAVPQVVPAVKNLAKITQSLQNLHVKKRITL